MSKWSLYKKYIEIRHLLFYDRPASVIKRVDFVEEAFKKFSKLKVKKILDLGTGSGEIATELGRRGYDVVAIDLSGDAVTYGSRKAAAMGVERVKFEQRDMRKIEYTSEFDAVTGFNSSLSLLSTTKDLLNVIKQTYKALRGGGILLADFINPYEWLLLEKSKNTIKMTSEAELFAISSTMFDNLVKPKINVKAVVFVRDKNRKLDMITHTETLQGYTSTELELLVRSVGFNRVRVCGDFDYRTQEPKRAFILNLIAVK